MAYTIPFAYFTGATPTDRVVAIYGNVAQGDPYYNYDDNPNGLKWWMSSDEQKGYIICQPQTAQQQPTPVSGFTAGVQFWSTETEVGAEFSDQSFVSLVNAFPPYRDASYPKILTPLSAVTWLASVPYYTSYGLQNGSASLNGTNYLSVNLSGKTPGTGNFTYEGYFFTPDLASTKGLWNTRSGNTTDGFDVAFTTGGEVAVTWTGAVIMISAPGIIQPKNWYHIAVVRSAGIWTLYINGISRATLFTNQDMSSGTLFVGSQALGANKFNGYISNFRYSNSVVYNSNFTPSGNYLTPLPSTQFLFNGFVGDMWLVDDSQNFLPINNINSVTSSPFNPFVSIINNPVLNLDATNYTSYPTSGNTWYDISGYGNNGTLSGGTTYNTGYFSFNGINSLVGQFSSVVGIPTGNQAYTISAWVQIENKVNDGGIAGWGTYGSTNRVNAFRLTSSGLVNYWWGNDYAVTTNLSTGSTWYMLTATFDGYYRRIYVNYSPVNYPGQPSFGHNVSNANNLTIGKTNNGNVEWFKGKISQVLIYNYDIGYGGVVNNYNATSFKYS